MGPTDSRRVRVDEGIERTGANALVTLALSPTIELGIVGSNEPAHVRLDSVFRGIEAPRVPLRFHTIRIGLEERILPFLPLASQGEEVAKATVALVEPVTVFIGLDRDPPLLSFNYPAVNENRNSCELLLARQVVADIMEEDLPPIC